MFGTAYQILGKQLKALLDAYKHKVKNIFLTNRKIVKEIYIVISELYYYQSILIVIIIIIIIIITIIIL